MKEKMTADFKSLLVKDKEYEELMSIKNGKTNIAFNLKKKGNSVSELIMLINGEEEFLVIQIAGNFLLDDIKKNCKPS